jgi:Leucine-rich repeat (LRR) protein
MGLSYNKFCGEISHNWRRCPQLTTLKIAGNNITSGIPLEIGDLVQLQSLDLSFNRLVGELPKEFGKLTSLVKLMLNGNKLSGGIPPKLGSLTNLEFLDLSTNRFGNSILTNMGNLLKLHFLNLSNKFSLNIPVQICKIAHLSQLDLSHNSLDGELPSLIDHLQSLELLISPTITFQVSFQLLLETCMACRMLTYPIINWRVLFPIAKHFKMLT